MGSARSQKIFLDKQSETRQKSSSSKKYTDLRTKVDDQKLPSFHQKSTYFHVFIHVCTETNAVVCEGSVEINQ